jgi:ribosomal-protein-alanine N-acetyltransferase
MEVMDCAFDPAFGEAWNRRQISDALAMPSTRAILLDAGANKVHDPHSDAPSAGFVLTRAAADEEELLLIAVRPEHRRRGLGEALITHLLDEARRRGTRRVFLEMRCGNPALRLYRKLGFEPIGRRAGYYRLSDGSRVDAITFGREL